MIFDGWATESRPFSGLIELGAEGEMIVRGPILCPRRNNFFVPLMEQQF
jgi:hypothetical protein